MEQIGFVGLGNMGGPIARRMLQHDASLLVYDKDPSAVARAAADGGQPASSVRDIADRCEIIFTCLPSPSISNEVAIGPQGFADGARVKIHVELSTSGGDAVVALSRMLQQRGIALIDSPVLGGKLGLEAGAMAMAVLSSGPEAPFQRIRPALERFAGRVFYLGSEPGMGQLAKLMNNSISLGSLLLACEAISIGVKAGLGIDTAVEIVNQGTGANYITKHIFPETIVKGMHGPTGAMRLALKDLQLFVGEARRLGMGTPVADAMSTVQEMILAAGPSDRDTLEAFRYFAEPTKLQNGDREHEP